MPALQYINLCLRHDGNEPTQMRARALASCIRNYIIIIIIIVRWTIKPKITKLRRENQNITAPKRAQ